MSEPSRDTLEPVQAFICEAGNVTFRRAQSEDEAFLLALYRTTRAQELAMVTWDENQKAMFVQMQFTAQSNHYREYFPNSTHDIVLLNGAPAGRLYVAHDDDAILIVDFLLVPAYRGLGIGTPLLQQLMAQAMNKNLPLRIHVETGSRALNLYQRLGFTHTETSDFHWLMEWKPD